MPAKILSFPTRYRPLVHQSAAQPMRQRHIWLRDRPRPLDRVEAVLLRLDWAVRARALRAHPHG